MTVYGEEAAAFVRAAGLVFDTHQAIGWGDPVEAAAVYHNWDRDSVEISVAGNRAWITRSRVREMFDYPFSFAGLVWGRTRSPVLRRAWSHLGGAEHDIPGLFTVVTLSRAQWLRYRDGIEQGAVRT